MRERIYDIKSYNNGEYMLSSSNVELDNSLPKIIFKYRDWDDKWHKRLISKQELYFSSPLKFNDPFDCRFAFSFDGISQNKILNVFQCELKKLYPNWTESQIQTESSKRCQPIISGDEDYIQYFSEQYMKIFSENIGIASFSREEDNILMWSHYAKNHSGICIGFDSELLFKATKGTIKKVKYVADYPVLEPPWQIKDKSDDIMFSHFLKIHATKSKFWEYEKEYRIIMANTTNTAIRLPKQAYKQIIIGSEFSKGLLDEFITTIKNEYPYAEILITRKNTKSYKLDFYKVK